MVFSFPFLWSFHLACFNTFDTNLVCYHRNNEPERESRCSARVSLDDFREDMVFGIDTDSITHRHLIDPMIQCLRCKAFVWIQESLKSTRNHRDGPQFSFCCSKGQIVLPDLRPIPRLLELVSGDTDESVHFRSKIRQYNSSLSFTSMGADVDRALANSSGGVYTFRVGGEVTHHMGSLLPLKDQPAKFGQIYILDPIEQAIRRNEIFDQQLDEHLLLELQQILEVVNPFCRRYKSIRQREYGKRISSLKIILKDRQSEEQRQQRQRQQQRHQRQRRQ